MKYNLFAPDGMEIGYITDSPEFDYNLVENAPFSEQIETVIKKSADYEMVVAGGPDEMEDDAVTPPEENVPASDFFRVVHLSTDLQANTPVQVEEVEDTKKSEIVSDLASLIDKKRRYVDSPADAPEGVDLQEGPQDGLYYETESTGNSSETPTDDESEPEEEEQQTTRNVFEELGVDINNIKESMVQSQTRIPALKDESAEKLKSALSEKHGEETFNTQWELYQNWKGSSSGTLAQKRELPFMKALGIEGNLRPLDDGDKRVDIEPSDELVNCSRDIIDASRNFLNKHFADESGSMEVYRGLSAHTGYEVWDAVFSLFGRDETIESVEFPMLTMANYSLNSSIAEEFGRKSVSITEERSIDEAITVEQQLYGSGGEAEVTFIGGDREVPVDQISIQSSWKPRELLENSESLDDDSWDNILSTCRHTLIRNKFAENRGDGLVLDKTTLEGIVRVADHATEHSDSEKIHGLAAEHREKAMEYIDTMPDEKAKDQNTISIDLTTEENYTWLSQIEDGENNEDDDDDDEDTTKVDIANSLVSLIDKKRRYVQSPADAPDGVSLEEGPQGGVYYETEAEGGESEESGSEQNSLDDHKQSIADAFRESLEEEEENDNDDYYDEILDNVDIDTESEEMIRDMQFEEIKDMIQERVVDNMADVMERCHSEEVRHTFLSEISKIKNKVQQSAFSSETKHIQFYTFVGSSTVQHEFGHAIAGTHDFELGSNGTSMYSRMYDDEIPDFQFGRTYKEVFDEWLDTKSEEARASWKSSEPYEELTNQFDIPMEKEHFKLSQVEGKTTAIDGLIEEVNNAWETMAEVPDNPDMDEEEYIFNRAYAATNAHETMAGIHETMQGNVGHEQAMENLVYRYPDLLHEYLELFEPSINPKQTIAKMWYRNGEELPGFDEAPFGMSQSDAYGF